MYITLCHSPSYLLYLCLCSSPPYPPANPKEKATLQGAGAHMRRSGAARVQIYLQLDLPPRPQLRELGRPGFELHVKQIKAVQKLNRHHFFGRKVRKPQTAVLGLCFEGHFFARKVTKPENKAAKGVSLAGTARKVSKFRV